MAYATWRLALAEALCREREIVLGIRLSGSYDHA
jgi:hypothetical protein